MPDLWDEIEEADRRADREFRREQAAAEAESYQLHLASRSLTNVAWEAMQEGHRIRLAWPGGEVEGLPSAAVGDLVVIHTPHRTIAVNTRALSTVAVTERRAGTGAAGDRTVESFIAWCRMTEGREVQISVVGGHSLEGTLIANAPDHLLLQARHGDQIAVARSQTASVSVAGDPFVAL